MFIKLKQINGKVIELEFESIEVGDLIIDSNGIRTTADLHVGSEGSGAAIIVNDGNLPNGEGVRLQATDSQNVAVELPNISGNLSVES